MVKSDPLDCRQCGNSIFFDSEVLSKNGKKIPLDSSTGDHHDCPNNPYNKGQRVQLGDKRDENLNLELVAKVGKLENVVNDVVQQVAQLERGLEQFGEALAKNSFETGKGKKV